MSPRLALYFLGSPQLYLDNEPILIERRKVVALLAYLALEHGRHLRESLSALLWPDYDQSKAFTNLRHTLWEIQQAIGQEWLIADRERIRLNEAADIWLDVRQFESLLAQSRAQNDISLRIPLLVESTKLYRNHFLTGFSLKDAPNFNEWAFAESEDLRCQLADALTMLSEDHCAFGQTEKAVPYARRLITLDPLNESAHRRLMKVYLQAGQHSAALKQYQVCEEILRKELNLDPQPETYALYKQIRKREIKPVEVVKPSEPVLPRHNLPLQLSSFIGREKEQRQITDLIANDRLVTLTGAGGIGKTRLSIQAAYALLNNFPNGTWLVELAPLSDPALVPQVIVTTLGLIEHANRPPQTILTAFLQAKKLLLVLDNCEHLIQACAQLAETLLQACPDLHILATSREALSIAGETLYRVPSLTTPDPMHVTVDTLSNYESVQLFVERAQSALADFTLTQENAPAIAQVCHHLDGIPLALELAAARVKLLRVEEIAARLSDRFHLLTGGTRTALPRHQTLQAMIDWSYDLLPESERILLRRLSVFAGGWSLEAAETVCRGDGIETHEILDLLTQLLNKSLIITEHKQGQETRYWMLETIRQYARDKLWVAGEGEMMRQRHLAHFVDLAERAEPNLRAFDMVMWLDRLEAEHDNIRAALEWAQESDVEAQLRLASALLWFWHLRGRGNEGIDWLERGLSIEVIEPGDHPVTLGHAMIRGKALNTSAILMAIYSYIEKVPARFEESVALFKKLGPAGKQGMAYAFLALGQSLSSSDRGKSPYEQSLALFREVGDTSGIAKCLMFFLHFLVLGENAQNNDDYESVVTLAQEHLHLQREIGDQDGIAEALADLGHLAFWQGDYQRAITLFEESLTGFRAVGNKWAISFWLLFYGFDLVLWLGNYERATKSFEEAFAFAQEVADRFLIAISGGGLGVMAWFQGNYARAIQMITDSLAVFRDISHYQLIATSMHVLGEIALAQGDEARAVEWYEAEVDVAREIRFETSFICTRGSLGKVAWVKGDYGLASKKFEEGLRMSREAGLKPAMFHMLYGLGQVAQSQGDYAVARTFYTEALGIQGWQVRTAVEWAWLKTYASAVAYPLSGLAALASAQNQMKCAASLLGAAETLFTPIRFEMSAKERVEHDQAIAAARAALGEEAFATAWEEGQKMTLVQAVEYAIEGIQGD